MDTSLLLFSKTQSQTLRFEYLIIILDSYATKIWTQPYVDHNIRKYEVTLPFFLKQSWFSILKYLIKTSL
jgi:hypothetical protein